MADAAAAPAGCDTLLGGRVRFEQPADGYRAAIDPVLLAAAVPARPGESVLDAGTGAGAAALCLLARVRGVRVTGVEIQPHLAALARRNATANGFADGFAVVDGDVTARPPPVTSAAFDHVMTNPPYRAAGTGTLPPDPAKAIATVEGPGGLVAWLDACLAAVRSGGTLTVVHRADRLADLLGGLAGRLGGMVVCPLWPAAGRPAGRIVVRGVKGGAAPLALHPGLTLHGPDGAYTAAAEAILRHGAALDL